MKNSFLILTLIIGTAVFTACSDKIDEVIPQAEVEEVIAPDGGDPEDTKTKP